jgi:acyl dehydratase
MKKYWDSLEVGDYIKPVAKNPITRVQIAQFAAASNDFCPLHLDDEYAKNLGFGSVFASNLLALGLAQEAIEGFALNMAMVSLTGTFQRLIWPGDALTAKAMIIRRYEKNGEYRVQFSFWCENQQSEIVAKGSSTCAVFKNVEQEKKQNHIKPQLAPKSHEALVKQCESLLELSKKKVKRELQHNPA